MTTKIVTFLGLLLVSVSVAAQEKPTKPEPQPKTVNREFLIEAGALGIAWTGDTVTTSVGLSRPHFREGGLLFRGSTDAGKVMGTWAAVDAGAIVISYEWKKHVHNRYLHPLWRVPLIMGISGHTKSTIDNARLLRRYP